MSGRGLVRFFTRKSSSKKSIKESKQGSKNSIEKKEIPEPAASFCTSNASFESSVQVTTMTEEPKKEPIPEEVSLLLHPDAIKFSCKNRIFARDVKYSMVTAVTQSWDQDLKTIRNWDRVSGEILFRKMFELQPECIVMFGFPADTKHDDPALSENPVFIKKGAVFVSMLDIALSLLGPDLEPLEEQLFELGKRHVAHQCQPHHWPMVGVALFHALDQMLGDKFTTEVQEGWTVLYNFLGFHMINGLLAHSGGGHK